MFKIYSMMFKILLPSGRSRFTARSLFSFVFLASALFATAQKSLQGKVIDDVTKEPIIGAGLQIKDGNDRTIATWTDVDGNFSVNIGAYPASVTVSYLGYRNSKIDIHGESAVPLVIGITETQNVLAELVVIGYGTQKRSELTGSVALVDRRMLEQKALSVDAMLGGAVAGVNVTQTSGQPGAGSEIRIRGGNSVYASNEPLYVIDGFIYFSEQGATQAGVSNIASSINPLASINPSDIESIEILKDVSAKAIYGSRGSNGVILVTTKKGTRGRNTVNYQYTAGIDKTAKKLKLTDADQWIMLRSNADYYYNATLSDYLSWQAANPSIVKNTDWQSAALQTGLSETHELSFSGGDDKTRYNISGNYSSRKGIVLNSGFDRFSGRINFERNIRDNFVASVNVSADRSVQNALTTIVKGDFGAATTSPFNSGITSSLVYALFVPPVVPVYAADGKYNHYNPFETTELRYYDLAANPVEDLETGIGQTLNSSLLGNFYVKWDVPYLRGLSLKVSGGFNMNYITQNFFASPTHTLGINQDIQGRAAVGNRRTDVTQTDFLLSYANKIGQAHAFDFLAGYTRESSSTSFSLSRVNHIEKFDNLGYGRELPNLTRSENASLQSLLGRVNYTALKRYNLTASFRADRSTRLSKGNYWGFFPSVGLSWNLSDEAFFAAAKKTVSTLKLRLTSGTAGQSEIGFNESVQQYEAGRYGDGITTVMINYGNSDLKWETTVEYNAGIDLGLWANLVTLTADVYYKKTSDLISLRRPPIGSATQEPQAANMGNLTNRGVELSAKAFIIDRSDLSWYVAANFARNINAVTSLWQDNYLINIGNREGLILRVGEPVGSLYGYVYEGVNPSSGDVLLKDLNGDGQILPSDDRQVLGSIQPDFTYGFSTSASWRSWDFFLSWQGSQGGKVYNNLRASLMDGNKDYNFPVEALDAWTPANTGSNIPKLDNKTYPTSSIYSRFVEDASFLKLRNITLGYTLPLEIGSEKLKFRFFLAGQNLISLSRYKGYDPEVAGGVDTGAYPTSRTFLFGLGLTF